MSSSHLSLPLDVILRYFLQEGSEVNEKAIRNEMGRDEQGLTTRNLILISIRDTPKTHPNAQKKRVTTANGDN